MTIYQRLESLESEYNAYYTDSDYWSGIKYAIDILNGYEHGQWIDSKDPIERHYDAINFRMRCSICNECGSQYMKFCPNCGSKMI